MHRLGQVMDMRHGKKWESHRRAGVATGLFAMDGFEVGIRWINGSIVRHQVVDL